MASQEFIQLIWIISLIIYVAFVCCCFAFGFKFFKLSREKKKQMTGLFFMFISLFFIFVGVGYILRIILTFIMPVGLQDFYDQLIQRTDIAIQQVSRIHAFFNYLGFAMLSASVEFSIYKKKTKYIISSLIVASISIILLILPYDVAILYQIIPFILIGATVGLLIITYIYLAIKNPGVVRAKSITVALGLIVYIFGMLINNYSFLQGLDPDIQFIRYTIIAPIVLIIANLLLYDGYREKNK